MIREVDELMDLYLENERTIILAVLPSNQVYLEDPPSPSVRTVYPPRTHVTTGWLLLPPGCCDH